MGDFPWTKWAREAMLAEIAGDMPRRNRALVTLAQSYGDDAPQIMLAWIDTALENIGIDPKKNGNVQLAFHAIETGEVRDIDEVPPDVVAAARLISARLHDDKATFEAVLQSIPAGEQQGLVFQRVLTAVCRWVRDGGFEPTNLRQ